MGTLSDDTVRLVKSTAPALKVHGGAVVEGFYALLFEKHPTAAAYFNVGPTDGAGGRRGQSKAPIQRLGMAVLFYAESIDKLDTLGPVLERISAKHVSRSIPNEFYPIIGSCLLQSIGTVLGEAASPAVIGAWTEAYGFLADALMATEAKIAARLAASASGWTGYAPFVVASVTKEAVPPPGRAASLVLRPAGWADGRAPVAPAWKAGHYVGLRVPVPASAGGGDDDAAGAVTRRTLFVTSPPAAADLRVTLVAGPDVPADPVVEALMNYTPGTGVEVSAPLGSFTWDSPVLGTCLPDAPAVFVTSVPGLPEVATMVRAALTAGRAVTLVRLVTGAGADAPAVEQLLGAELAAAGDESPGDLRQLVIGTVADVPAAVGAGVAAAAEFFVAATPPTLAGAVRDELVGGGEVPVERVRHAGYVPA